MQKEKNTITVLKSFDGMNANQIDSVERTIQYGGHKDSRGRPQNQRRSVSYKGKNCTVFALSKSYGLENGLCISVD